MRQHAFVWQDQNGNGQSDAGEMTDLNSLLPANSGWVLHYAQLISDNGDIVGYGAYNGQGRVFRMSIANAASTAVADVATTAEDEPISINVLANDSDPDGGDAQDADGDGVADYLDADPSDASNAANVGVNGLVLCHV